MEEDGLAAWLALRCAQQEFTCSDTTIPDTGVREGCVSRGPSQQTGIAAVNQGLKFIF